MRARALIPQCFGFRPWPWVCARYLAEAFPEHALSRCADLDAGLIDRLNACMFTWLTASPCPEVRPVARFRLCL